MKEEEEGKAKVKDKVEDKVKVKEVEENKGKSISIESTLDLSDKLITLIEEEFIAKNEKELQESPESGYEFITAMVSVIPFHYISSMGAFTAKEIADVEKVHVDMVRGFYKDVAPALLQWE